jgi:hypothetical protein
MPDVAAIFTTETRKHEERTPTEDYADETRIRKEQLGTVKLPL